MPTSQNLPGQPVCDVKCVQEKAKPTNGGKRSQQEKAGSDPSNKAAAAVDGAIQASHAQQIRVHSMSMACDEH